MVADLAAEVLAAIVAAYADEAIDLPARQYVADGPPAYDCEQVVVALVRLYPGLPFLENPSAPVLQATLLRTVTLAVHVVRCIPTVSDRGKAPSAAVLGASGVRVLTDAYMVPTSLVRAWHAGTFRGRCESFGIREAVPAEPSGGFGGTIVTMDAQF